MPLWSMDGNTLFLFMLLDLSLLPPPLEKKERKRGLVDTFLQTIARGNEKENDGAFL